MSIHFSGLSFFIWGMGLKSPNSLVAMDSKQNSYHKGIWSKYVLSQQHPFGEWKN